MKDTMVTYETKIFVNGEEVDKIFGGTYIMKPMDNIDVLLTIITEQVKGLGKDDLEDLKAKLKELGAIK